MTLASAVLLLFAAILRRNSITCLATYKATMHTHVHMCQPAATSQPQCTPQRCRTRLGMSSRLGRPRM